MGESVTRASLSIRDFLARGAPRAQQAALTLKVAEGVANDVLRDRFAATNYSMRALSGMTAFLSTITMPSRTT